ncbi:hypothetical protein CK203_029224 [Vitis vinifera]|uniref:Uncharacterized protein n=1 Tax=Vitis vinifera TaxID=29760 RepID=A0A438ISZ3_VITVI|nr:hypothetical protein CK203_029224 [Vitis vinifera]
MDRIEQRVRQLRVSDGAAVWDDLEGMPVASLSAKFRMPDIEIRIEERARGSEVEDRGVVSFFISRWCGKIAEIVDRPSERDQIQMVLRSLQPRIARHVVGVPFADFGSLVMALYDVEDNISRELWTDSSPSDIKGKKPFVGPRSADGIERPAVSYTATGQPCYTAQLTARPMAPYPRPRAQ